MVSQGSKQARSFYHQKAACFLHYQVRILYNFKYICFMALIQYVIIGILILKFTEKH